MKIFSLMSTPSLNNPDLFLYYLKKDNVVYIDSIPYENVDINAKSKNSKTEMIKNKVLKRVKNK